MYLGKQELYTGRNRNSLLEVNRNCVVTVNRNCVLAANENCVVVFVAVITLIMLNATEKELASSRRHLSESRRHFVSGALLLRVDLW